MIRKYITFLKQLSRNTIGKIGVILSTSAFITFILLEIMQLAGIIHNAYIGLIIYLLFPSLFILGLILIPFGWHLRLKSTGKTSRELLSEVFVDEQGRHWFFGSPLLWTIGGLTLANVIFLSGVSFQALHFMDQSEFCGTACHTVMNPEYVVYQSSPHARVPCVDCHVGEGLGAMVDAKLNGVWQMVSAGFNLYQRPIPTPVHNLRPARETCEKCHWPEKFYGQRLKSIIHYAQNEKSTPGYTTLLLKVDAGKGAAPAGIHWHIAAENEVRYASLTVQREEMLWVEVRQPDGNFKRYTNRKLIGGNHEPEEIRYMDCVDCHNRATHIYEQPSPAIDERLRSGQINKDLPFIKREALAALTGRHPQAGASEKIEEKIKRFYRVRYPDIWQEKSESIIKSAGQLSKIYNRNIHPAMAITWGSYPDHIGHAGGGGCFRCHNQDLVDMDGHNISADCTMCHSILANESPTPFDYMNNHSPDGRDYLIREYLKSEFFHSIR